ncbi:MAG: ester cyclase [Rhodobacteraceae bacterium]|nr:ester cyclase [Paracoccaceae bacterium]
MTAPRLFMPPQRPAHVPADLAFGCLGAAWSRGDLGFLDSAVGEEAVLRQPGHVGTGPGSAMAEALADLAAFPGAEILAEDALEAETGDSASDAGPGTYVAARATMLASHHGPGRFGPGSGRTVQARTMGDFWIDGDGRVQDAWVIRDTAAILAQTGGPAPRDWARAQIAAAGKSERMAPPLTPETDIEGPYGARGSNAPAAAGFADLLRRIMGGEIAAIASEYDPACELAHPGAGQAMGHRAATAFWAGLRSALPSAAFRVEHRIAASDPGRAPRAALRWSLYGRHDGHGRWGPPTGAYVHVLGLTHAEFGPGGLRREWTLIDDAAIWTQILLATGAH